MSSSISRLIFLLASVRTSCIEAAMIARKGGYSLGRVQTPTLAMVCRRYIVNRDFSSVPFWKLSVLTEKEGLSLKAIGSRNYENEASAQTALAALRSQSRLKVELVARKVGGTPPPLLYDLTALQKDANKRHGFSADKTLSIAQSLYEKVRLSVTSETMYDQRKGFFSYSSAHQQMAENFKVENNQKLEDQSQVERQEHEEDNLQPVTETSAVLPDTLADDGVDPTNLGSAFHELAQIMVETQSKVDEQTIDRQCLKNSVPQRAVPRVKQALELWSNSAIRQEALAHDVVIAESPFTLQVDSEYGNYVEGAIDLLAYNKGSKDALVVDYKTGDKGLSATQIYEHHQMQANFYAYVLMQRGFTKVECAFVCVEVEEAGQPHVARYTFDVNHQPRL